MKSYKLCFGDKISPFMKMDIENVLKNKIALSSNDNADTIYTVSINNSIPHILKKTKVCDEISITNNILHQETLWNQCLFNIKKTQNTIILPSSPDFDDIALSLSLKLQCESLYNKEIDKVNIINYDNIIIIGNHDMKHLYQLRISNPNSNIEIFSINSNINIDYVDICDIIYLLTIDNDSIIQYPNVIVLDIVDVITDCIITNFYNL